MLFGDIIIILVFYCWYREQGNILENLVKVMDYFVHTTLYHHLIFINFVTVGGLNLFLYAVAMPRVQELNYNCLTVMFL